MMDIDVTSAAAELDGCAQALGFSLTDGERDGLVAYLGLLTRWNAVYNLTAVRDPQAMLAQHLADCLSVVPSLRRCVSESGKASPRLLDVGSGGGLPGVVLAVLMPGLAVTCVDTVGKKAAFIRQVGAELRLSNLAALHARVENMPGMFDLVVSRAFSSLGDFTRWTRERLAPDGVWVAMKGKRPDSEIAELPASIEVFHVEQITVPKLDAERCLVWMRSHV